MRGEIISKQHKALKEADISTDARSSHVSSNGNADMRLEVDLIPVSDVETSKQFYLSLGWRFDDDSSPADNLRIVQFTPPGSDCSVTFGKGITQAPPGSAEGGLTVTDIEAAHDELLSRGINVSDVWHGAPSRPRHGSAGPTLRIPATGRSAPSPIPTATPGLFRKSRPGFPAASDTSFRIHGGTRPVRLDVPRPPPRAREAQRAAAAVPPLGPRPALARLPRRLPGGRAGREGPVGLTG
jgi:catechol 2,3-dioxygenase-like lactoylglutathione lyase family enzyme